MGRKVMVVGDVILDEYVYGTRLGLAAETPTIVAKQLLSEKFVGGAGLVARHLLRLGCDVTLVGVHGKDEDFPKFYMTNSSDVPTTDELNRLSDLSLSVRGWNMTQKRRFFVDDYKLLQYDTLNEGVENEALVRRFVHGCMEVIRSWGIDTLVICDNRHGMSRMMSQLAKEVRYSGLKPTCQIYVDSQLSQAKESNLEEYEMADCFLVNERELDGYLDKVKRKYDPYCDTGSTCQQKLKVAERLLGGNVVLKLGSDGCVALLGGEAISYPAANVKVVDTCGAGDAFLAALVATQNLEKANRWAGLSTTYKGTIVPREELP